MITTRNICCALLSGVSCAFLLYAQPLQAQTLVQVVVDNSGVLHDEQDPRGKTNFNRFTRKFLTQLARKYRRDRDETQIKVISAVDPPNVIWSGTAAEFYRDGLKSIEVEALMANPPNGCNNLPEAFEEVSVNSKIAAQEAETKDIIHIITSGVHSGPDCQSLTQSEYPELVTNADPDVIEALKLMSAEFQNVLVHFLTATQRREIFKELGNGSTVKFFAQGDQPRF